MARKLPDFFKLLAREVRRTQVFESLIRQRRRIECAPVTMMNFPWVNFRLTECRVAGSDRSIPEHCETGFPIRDLITIEQRYAGIVQM